MKPGWVLAGVGAVAWLLLGGRRSPAPAPTGPSRPEPEPGDADRVASLAEQEAARWGGRLESTPWGAERIALYWSEGARQPFPGTDVPWSGAFVVWTANTAVPGALVPTGAHVYYTAGAMRGEGRYRLHEPDGAPLARGDIIVKGREGERVTLEDVRSGRYVATHGDIVTKVGPGWAQAIGGNKFDTVKAALYQLRADGTLDPRENVFAVLRLDARPAQA